MFLFRLKKTAVHKQEKILWIMKKLNSCAKSRKLSSRDIISVCGSIPIKIPILWPRAVMVGPRPRVLLTLPLAVSTFLLLTSLFIQPHKQNPNGVRSGDSNSSISVTIHNYTHVHMTFFCSQWPILPPPKISNFTPESSCMLNIWA